MILERLNDYLERAREAGIQGELLNHLKKVPLFSVLGESQLVYLANQLQGRAYAPHERIFEQGSLLRELHVVLEGQTELRQLRPDGNERVAATVTAGHSFGEIGFLTGEPRHLAAVNGSEPGLHVVLSAFDFERVLALAPDVGHAIYQRLLEQITERAKTLLPATRTYVMWGYGAPAASDLPGSAVPPGGRRTALAVMSAIGAGMLFVGYLVATALGPGATLLCLLAGGFVGAAVAQFLDSDDHLRPSSA